MPPYNTSVVTTLRLCSADSLNDTDTNTSFRINFTKMNLSSVKRACVTYVSFANVFDNVTAPNNVVVIEYDNLGSTATITVPPGRYTATTLAAYITNEMVVTYGEADFMMSVVNDFYFSFDNPTGSALQILSTGTTMNDIIGLLPSDLDTEMLPGPYTLSSPMDLMGPKTAYVYARQLSEDFVDSEFRGSKFNVVATVPVAQTSYGAMVQWMANDIDSNKQYFARMDGRDCTSIDVRLRDQDGVLLDLGNKPLYIIVRLYHN